MTTPLATHTGRDARGRRVPLVHLDGRFLTPGEAKSRLKGFTREEVTYTDIRVLDREAADPAKERATRAGCVYLARSRRTGALRGVYRAREAGIDGDGWATVCEDHGTLVLSETRALALMSDTNDFCDDCRAEE